MAAVLKIQSVVALVAGNPVLSPSRRAARRVGAAKRAAQRGDKLGPSAQSLVDRGFLIAAVKTYCLKWVLP